MTTQTRPLRQVIGTSVRSGVPLAVLAGVIHALTIVRARTEIEGELEAALETHPELAEFAVEELYHLILLTTPPITVGAYLVVAVIFGVVYDRYLSRGGEIDAYVLAALVGVALSFVWGFRLPLIPLVGANVALWLGFTWLFFRFRARRSASDEDGSTAGGGA
ncbi:hypothetical protein [Natrarchaeobius chitinivorans]|uniref:Uncharacterized protein n=1 Tax=Natrarchaeobius chitinivorans TaxID=1679083 RepID=A0A3N6M0H6_NATCH|nr:hypothetical protein [Natrarchaeobius chitinivorans]RQG95077.1 hypothetical protein EA473_08975 [Natrarchaeobius chitinivorans]